MKIRKAELKDVNELVEVEKMVWGSEAATKEMVLSRIKIFPEGNFVATISRKIVGVVFVEIINSTNNYMTWYDYTDNGLIKKSHKYNGDTLFGIGLSVLPEYGNKGIGTELLVAVGELAVKKGLRGGILGGRMPYYKNYKNLSPEEYMKLRDEKGQAIDPEIRFYERAGLKIKKLIPNYFSDADSSDFGILLEWRNPFYFVKGKKLRVLAGKLFKILFKIELRLAEKD